ncbi:MAG: alpha/beta fold hydrolase [Burkholderiaceae bacterium]
MTTLALAFEETGSGDPLLLLHGLYGSGTNWRRIAKALSDRHRVVSVDLRNHGASPWAATMSYAEMAGDVAALIDRLGLERPAILGHSMGGKVAMTLALTDPARVGSLIVVDIAPVSYGDHFSTYTQAMRGVDAVQATSRDEIRRVLLQTIPDDRIVGFLMTNLVRQGEQYDWRINLMALAASMHEIGSFPESLAGLTFEGPVTVIDGERSDYVSAGDRPRFLAHFPAARFVTIADAGHWLHADQPEPFIAAVRAALNGPAEG